ncbi:MAG: radical SAM protein [Candidatus Omnitrophica bacterium]|nr:radical SAM protein [Candidatus Omnitrophota bacterium]
MKKAELLAAYNLSKAKFFRKKIPLVVGWSVTNRCNWHCAYCTRWSDHSEELDTKQIYSILDELFQMGTYSINFTGGEPLIRDDIDRIVYYAKRKGINVTISSNGSLVSQKIKEIRKANPLIIISYDGPQDVHGRQRQKDSYQSVLDAIEAAKKCNIFVKLHTVLTRHNIEHVDSILDFAKKLDLTVNFAVVEFTPFSKEEAVKTLLPPKDKYKSALKYLIFEKRKGNSSVSNSLSGLQYLEQWPEYRKINCCAGRIYCRIESNGDVFPCGNLIFKSKPRNCLELGFKNAFENIEFNDCKSCWCDTRIELNRIYSFNLGAILEVKRTYKL